MLKKIIEETEGEFKKIIPSEIGTVVGLSFLCVIIFVFELIFRVRLIEYLPLKVGDITKNIFNMRILNLVLQLWLYILIGDVLLEFAIHKNNKKKGRELTKWNVEGIRYQFEKFVILYLNLLLMIKVNPISIIFKLQLVEIGFLNIIFILFLMFWYFGFSFQIVKYLFIPSYGRAYYNNRIAYKEWAKRYRIAKKIVKDNKYYLDSNNLSLRKKTVDRIEKELQIFENGIDIDEIVRTLKEEDLEK